MRRSALHWSLGALDKWSAIRTLEILGAELGRAGVGRVQVLIDEGDDWPDDLAGGWHHMGTTRMATDPTRGVVDADSRVHGTANLYVAGSSVFPTSGYANPTLTIVSLALRLWGNVFAGGLMISLIALMPVYILWAPTAAWKLFELFIGLLQALIFTLLTIIYFSEAVGSDEAAHH